jgi:hypothetical protein
MSILNNLDQLIPILGIANFVAIPLILWGVTCAQIGRGAGKLSSNLFQLVGYLGIFVGYYLIKDSQYLIFYFLISLGIVLFSFLTEVKYYFNYEKKNKIEVNSDMVKNKTQNDNEEQGIDEDRMKEIINGIFFFGVIVHLLGLFGHFAILLSYCQ